MMERTVQEDCAGSGRTSEGTAPGPQPTSAKRAAPPLAGVKVIDFSELLPGPFFTQCLAQMGAKVLKIERAPHGDNVRRMGPGVFTAVNRGKRSLRVDLKDEKERARVLALTEQADVLVETYRPGVMERLGLGFEQVLASSPRLIYLSLTGYGQKGPWAQFPGHDINYLGAAGALAISGVDPAGEPAQSFGLPIADLCGAMYALSATLAALYQREQSGRGQHLDVAMADTLLHWMTPRLGAFVEAGATSWSQQRQVSLVKPAYGAFKCSDGRYVTIAALEDHFWSRLASCLPLGAFAGPEFAQIAARKPHASAINESIARAAAGLESGTLVKLLIERDVPVSPMIEPSHLLDVEQFALRGRLEPSGQGALPLVHFPVTLEGMNDLALHEPPALDEARREELFDSAGEIWDVL